MSKLRKISLILFAGILCLQLFARVGSSARAQEPVPTIPAPVISVPPYLESTPVKEDVEPGTSIFQPDGPDASGVISSTLSSPNNKIHGLIFYGEYLWASTRTAPGRILKIDPSNLIVDNGIILESNRNNAEDIVAANGYIWSIAIRSETDGASFLVRVNPSTMAVGYTQIVLGGNNLYLAESLEYNFGYLWVGGYNGIAKIDISNPLSPSIISIYDYSTLVVDDYMLGTALSSDSNYLWTMFTQGNITPPAGYISTTLVRINPNDPSGDYLAEGLDPFFPDDMLSIDENLYTSSELSGIPSVAYRFPTTITPYITQTAFSTGVSYGVFSNPLEVDTFWGAFTGSPGTLLKFDLNLNRVFTVTLPTNFDDPSEIVFDPSGNMYVSTFQEPARLVKYTTPDAVTVSISRSGSDAVLSWTNSDPLIDHYEVWRSTDRNFNPGDSGSTKVDVTAVVGGMSYTDTGVISDRGVNYYYLVRAFNDYGLFSQISNRVGEINIQLATGLNLITLPVQPIPALSAEPLLQDVFAQGTNCNEIDRWTGTAWSAHFRGFPFNNFSTAPGSGYFVRCTTSGDWTVVGEVIDFSIPVSLVSGWSLIGVPFPLSTYFAQSLLDQANAQGGACSEINRWTGTAWSAHFNGFPFNNFAIINDKGYFMRCTMSSTLIP